MLDKDLKYQIDDNIIVINSNDKNYNNDTLIKNN